jgi:putative toxin-antitoxin system antitoxin component (TIGR02293 family)
MNTAALSSSIASHACVVDLATRVFGSHEAAERWLLQKSLALDGERPLDLLTSASGREAIQDLLTRIECGVYA